VKPSNTYQHIADILSFKTSNNFLQQQWNHTEFNWDTIVVLGSQHLIIPALYQRLKSRNLLHLLPEGLELYLDDIASQNRQRNLAILEQVKSLTLLLNSHNIKHAFLKGAALLAADYFEDYSERMIGDIDILIEEKDLSNAFELLKTESYQPIEATFGADFFEHKHLPRLTSTTYICAVELHRKLFVKHKDIALSNANILKHKRQINDTYVPSHWHLLLHNILNYQINDLGQHYKTINFRSAYDTIILSQPKDLKSFKTAETKIKTTKDKALISYFKYLNVFFEDLRYLGHNKASWLFLLKLNNRTLYKFWYRALTIKLYLATLIHRFLFALTHRTYLKALWKDKKRVLNLLKRQFS